jgi:hypothetical protein
MASDGKSPYARRKKRPHRYSPGYYEWLSTGKKLGFDHPETRRLSDKFYNNMGVRPPRRDRTTSHP